jgi:hypothetical protein
LICKRWLGILLSAVLCNGSPNPEEAKPSLKLDRQDLTALGVTIGSSTLAGAKSSLGDAQTLHVGHGDKKEDAVCYRSASAKDDTVVTLYAGALGGWIDVTRISVSKSRSLPWSLAMCKSHRLVSRNLEFLRGLRLGSQETDVVRALGPPSRSTKTQLYYYVSHQCGPELPSKKKPSSDCEVVDSVEARFTSEEGLAYMSFYHFIDR